MLPRATIAEAKCATTVRSAGRWRRCHGSRASSNRRARRWYFVYEAGPCGFGLYRLLKVKGHECWVVSPGMTPRSNADRVKTDRRDCLKLCASGARGELTPIHVPDAADEAMRDLVRAREDAVIMQRQARQRLGALLLRNDVRYNGKTLWSAASALHRRDPTAARSAAHRLRRVRAGGR